LKINIELENDALEDDFPLPGVSDVRFQPLIFWGVKALGNDPFLPNTPAASLKGPKSSTSSSSDHRERRGACKKEGWMSSAKMMVDK